MDEELRHTERAARSGDPSAEIALLRFQVMTGQVVLDYLPIAAKLGHRGAQRLLDGVSESDSLETIFSEIEDSPTTLLAGLVRAWSQRCARGVLDLYLDAFPTDRVIAETLDLIEAWITGEADIDAVFVASQRVNQAVEAAEASVHNALGTVHATGAAGMSLETAQAATHAARAALYALTGDAHRCGVAAATARGRAAITRGLDEQEAIASERDRQHQLLLDLALGREYRLSQDFELASEGAIWVLPDGRPNVNGVPQPGAYENLQDSLEADYLHIRDGGSEADPYWGLALELGAHSQCEICGEETIDEVALQEAVHERIGLTYEQCEELLGGLEGLGIETQSPCSYCRYRFSKDD